MVFALAAPATPVSASETPPSSALALELELQADPTRLKETAQAQLADARKSGDPRAELAALRRLAMSQLDLEEFPAARKQAEIGMPLARSLSDVVAQSEFTIAIAIGLELSGHMPDALKLLDDGLALAEREGHPEMVARLQIRKGGMLNTLNRSAEALDLFTQAHAAFEKIGDTLSMSSALSAMASVSYRGPDTPRPEIERAIALLEQANALLDPVAHPRDVLQLTANLAMYYVALRDLASARTRFEHCLVMAGAWRDLSMLNYCHKGLGTLARDEGRYDEALEHLAQALPARHENANPQQILTTYLTIADVHSLKGERGRAHASLALAARLLPLLDSPKVEARYHLRAAEIHARLGASAEAYRAMVDLRRAERAANEADNKKLSEELKIRFDTRLKDKENDLLRAEKQAFEAKRTAMVLGLVLSLLVAGGLGLYLVRQVRQKRQFADLALHDELTGAHNRRSILDFARLHWSGRRAGDMGLAVAMLDIDRFKSVNDTYGHEVGDAVLIAFARACQSRLRHEDRLGRYGGEEFLVVMPATKAAEIPVIFERLRSAVQALQIPGLPPEVRLTFSMGGAQTQGHIETLDQLIKAADTAMYKAKQAGRDRVVVEAVRTASPESGISTPCPSLAASTG